MSRGCDAIFTGGDSLGHQCAGALAKGGLRVALVEGELAGGERAASGAISAGP